MGDWEVHGRHDDRTTGAGRNLLPRRPSDPVVALLVILGIFGGLITQDESLRVAVVLPAVVATLVQKVKGHRAAWRSEGVERAFILESSAISF